MYSEEAMPSVFLKVGLPLCPTYFLVPYLIFKCVHLVPYLIIPICEKRQDSCFTTSRHARGHNAFTTTLNTIPPPLPFFKLEEAKK